ncbi:MAG: DUF4386 domain-containing protein [Thermoleophilia bacterium]
MLFLITFVTSISALALFQPVLDDPAGYIAGPGADGRVLLGVVFELVLILANVGSAVVLVPLFHRGSDHMLSIGFVTARIVESTFIAAGVLGVLGIVSLRHDDPSAASLAVSLAAMKDWTFLLGPGLVCGLGNGVILGALMFRSGLVPKRMTMLGLVGGPLLTAVGVAVVLGAFPAGGAVQAIATVPEFLWELSLGLYLTATGLRGSSGIGAAARIAGPQPVA